MAEILMKLMLKAYGNQKNKSSITLPPDPDCAAQFIV